MGVAGSGKSTVAMHYAKGSGFVFVEADDFHPPANVAKMKSGQPLTDEDRVGWLAAMAQRITEGKARGETMVITCSALKRS
ncbi:MAG: thermoresistant gluconokinase, partial [Verrucomicrobiota bacterium]